MMAERERIGIVVQGLVQGVGFRPFVYRLAAELGLVGWVCNSPQGVLIEVEGPEIALEQFLSRLESDHPPLAALHHIEVAPLPPAGELCFEIRHSNGDGAPTALVLPDIATCPDCLADILDPDNRRYRYPFTNCTNCGPRYSIIEALPYDRPATTMKHFEMCRHCAAEYHNPADRRFHAQPNACPECGPRLELWTAEGVIMEQGHYALLGAVEALRAGAVVALKGLGGFHLLVDARNEAAVRQLRRRKNRPHKPFALMMPSLEMAAACCEISPEEAALLASPMAPIVLLRRLHNGGLAPSVAPDSPYLGLMLPYTPLHHLLLRELKRPVVATSGNRADEPICTDEYEALERLDGIADLFLVHNRPILRPVDDSVACVVEGRTTLLRRARGYAPLPLPMPHDLPPLLALGAHQKNTVALAAGKQLYTSQHIGDLDTLPARDMFHRVAADLQTLHALRPQRVMCDLHPDYYSTRRAHDSGLPVHPVQHHYAHVLSAMLDNGLAPPLLGVAWDGTGYGPDGTIWGGEFLHIDGRGYTRVGHLRTFCLPGGDQAVREPRRSALGLLYEVFGPAALDMPHLPALQAFTPAELGPLGTMLARGLNSPRTSSAGRLFDAVASLLGLCQRATYEGQAAVMLEHAALNCPDEGLYPFALAPDGALNWESLLRALLADRAAGLPAGVIAARFHNTLASMIVSAAQTHGEPVVVLSGGCFQNRYLLTRSICRLRESGLRPHWHHDLPPNDGGIAPGQALAALYLSEE